MEAVVTHGNYQMFP